MLLSIAVVQARAQVNYLVLTEAGIPTHLTAKLASTCPTGYPVHHYGLGGDVLMARGNAVGFQGPIGPMIYSGTGEQKICISDVPSSIVIMPPTTYAAGFTNTPTPETQLVLDGASVDIQAAIQPKNPITGAYTFWNGLLAFPDGFIYSFGSTNDTPPLPSSFYCVDGKHYLDWSANGFDVQCSIKTGLFSPKTLVSGVLTGASPGYFPASENSSSQIGFFYRIRTRSEPIVLQ